MDKKYRILLVDDDPDFVTATRIVLESQSYEVLVANEGNAGVETARREMPDLILLDVIMPVRDGFAAAEQLKHDPQLKQIPVIMLTSFGSAGQQTNIPASRGMGLETEDYLEKPISPKDLLACVAQYLK